MALADKSAPTLILQPHRPVLVKRSLLLMCSSLPLWSVQTMLKDGLKPNTFVYNSMMNVNVGDLDEVQRYYQHMQVAILNSVIVHK